MDNVACLKLARVITGVRKRANTRAAETPAARCKGRKTGRTRLVPLSLYISFFAIAGTHMVRKKRKEKWKQFSVT